MRKHAQIFAGLFGAVILLLALVGGISASPEQPAITAPAPQAARIVNVTTAAITQDTNYTSAIWGVNTEADLYWRITEGSVNTISLELETSPDNTYWYNSVLSPTLVTSVVTTSNGYVGDIPIHGYYFRIVSNVSTANTVTPNIKVVLRP